MSPLIATVALLLAQPASQPTGAPVAGGGKVSDLYGELTIIYELGENALNAQESWRIRNDSGRAVAAKDLDIDLPLGSRRVRLDEGSEPFAASPDGTSIEAEAPFGPGERAFGVSYQIPISGSSATLSRNLPFKMGGARVIMQNVGGLRIESNFKTDFRTSDLNGLEFGIWQVEGMAAGSDLTLTIGGLPSQPGWPRHAAVGLCIGILGWMVLMLRRDHVARAQRRPGVLSASARRDRLIKAIELLDADLVTDTIGADQHKRRHSTLMKQLAETLRELDIEERGARSS